MGEAQHRDRDGEENRESKGHTAVDGQPDAGLDALASELAPTAANGAAADVAREDDEADGADAEPNLDALAAIVGGEAARAQRAESKARQDGPGHGAEDTPEDSTLDLARLTTPSMLPSDGRPVESAPPAATAEVAPAPSTPEAEKAPPASRLAAGSVSRPSWLLPLLAGMAVGVGASALLFLHSAPPATGPSASAPPAAGSVAAEATAPPSAPVAAAAPRPEPPPAAPPAVRTAPGSAGEGEAATLADSAQAPPAPRSAAARVPSVPPAARPAAAALDPASGARSRGTAAGTATSKTPPAGAAGQGLAQAPASGAKPAPESAEKLAAGEGEAGPLSAKQADRSMDQLLDDALAPAAEREARRREQEAMFAESALPATPSREQVTQAMTVLLPAIRGCAMGQRGLATATIVVRNSGRVANVSVAGAPFAGSPGGHCMEGVLRRARFPRFKQPSFRVKFPLAIQ